MFIAHKKQCYFSPCFGLVKFKVSTDTDYRLGTKCRVGAKYGLQTADCRLVAKHRLRIKTVFFVKLQIRDKVSFCYLPSVTQSLLRGNLGLTFGPFFTYLF